MKLFATTVLLLISLKSLAHCQDQEDAQLIIDYCLSAQGIEDDDFWEFIETGAKASEDMHCVTHCVLRRRGFIDDDVNVVPEAKSLMEPEVYANFERCGEEKVGETTCQKSTNLLNCVMKASLGH